MERFIEFTLFALFFLLLSSVTTITCQRYPEQIHISYGSGHGSMVVMWSSHDELDWEVHYGTLPKLLQMSANCTMAKLPDHDYKAAKYVYRSELKNLTSNTTYFFKIVHKYGRIRDPKLSIYRFKTLQNRNDFDTVSRFVVYGDMGARLSGPTRAAIGAFRKSKDIQAVLHIGDFAYNLNSDGGKVGDTFMNEIQSLAAEVPYMTAPGNHEISGNFEPYRVRFSTPNTPWPIPLYKMWYSFDVGLVHIISYSTEVYFTNNEEYVCEQFHWLMQDLITANQNRDKTPWIIAMGHRPMYCSNNDGDDCTDMFMRRWVKTGLEPLFHAQGVDMIIQAHEHSYERLYPLFDGEVERFNYVNPRAPVHIISGAAGSLEHTDGWSDSPNYWSAFRSTKKDFQSFGILEIYNRTHLFFTQVDAKDNATVDKFWMIQEEHGPFVENVNCLGSFAHESCFCHLPLIRLRTIIIICSVTVFLTLVVCVKLLITYLRKRNSRLLSNRICQVLCKRLEKGKDKRDRQAPDSDTEPLLNGQNT